MAVWGALGRGQARAKTTGQIAADIGERPSGTNVRIRQALKILQKDMLRPVVVGNRGAFIAESGAEIDESIKDLEHRAAVLGDDVAALRRIRAAFAAEVCYKTTLF
jgi:hypothetical protein